MTRGIGGPVVPRDGFAAAQQPVGKMDGPRGGQPEPAENVAPQKYVPPEHKAADVRMPEYLPFAHEPQVFRQRLPVEQQHAACIPYGDMLPEHAIDIYDGPGPDPILRENKSARILGGVGATAGLAGGVVAASMTPLHPFLGVELAVTTSAIGFGLGGLVSGRAGAKTPAFEEPRDAAQLENQHRQHEAVKQAVAAAVGARNADPQQALQLANEAVHAAQEFVHVDDRTVTQLKEEITRLYPSKAGNPAWLARSAAHLMINGVLTPKDQEEDGHTTRYGVQTLYETGIKRDFARSVSASLVNYTPSFGAANVGTEAMRQAGLPSAVGWLGSSAVIGFGQEHPMILGMAPSKYTRAPTADEKAHAMYALGDRASFWPFAVDHVIGDLALPFNVGYVRAGTGYAAAAMTGVQRAYNDLATAHFEPAWVDADHPNAAALVNDLRGTDAAAAGDFLKDLATNVRQGPLRNFDASRGLVRMVFAAACAAPRTAASVLGNSLDERARFGLMMATNGLLGGWGAINRYIVGHHPPRPGAGPQPLAPQGLNAPAALPEAWEVRRASEAMRPPTEVPLDAYAPDPADMEALLRRGGPADGGEQAFAGDVAIHIADPSREPGEDK